MGEQKKPDFWERTGLCPVCLIVMTVIVCTVAAAVWYFGGFANG